MLLVLTACVSGLRAQDAAKHKKVLLLLNNDSFTAPQIKAESALRETLKNGSSYYIETNSEYVGNTRTGNDYEKEFVALMKRKYEGKKFDLIFAHTSAPLNILRRDGNEMFPNTPVVYITVDRKGVEPADLGPDMTAVSGQIDFKGNLELALEQNPGTKRVVLIEGVAETDKYWSGVAQQDLQEFESRLEFSHLKGLTVPEMRAALAALPSDAVVFFVTCVRDQEGNIYDSPEYLRQVASASSRPIYGTTDAQLGNGIVGGWVASLDTLGEEGGKTGLRILEGEKVQDIPPRLIKPTLIFDWRELQRWGMSEANLPVGSTVKFQSPSVWGKYKWYVWGAVAAVVAEGLFIGLLIVIQMRRRRAEAKNAHLTTQLKEIVSNVPGIVWESRYDPEIKRRRTVFISDQAQKMLGYSAKEWLKQPPGFGLTLMPEEDREKAAEVSETVVESGMEGVSEFRWITKDGRILWIENYLSPMFDTDGKVVGLRGVALDVTDRKLVEEKDRAIMAALPDIMFVQSVEGIFLDYHAKDPGQLLTPPEEFLGKNMHDILPPELADKLAAGFARAAEGGEPQIIEYRLQIGELYEWFEARIVPMGDNILSLVRDITDRKRAEQETLELGGRLIQVQENERMRLGRELHDGAAQMLAVFAMELELFKRQLPEDGDAAEQIHGLSTKVAELSTDLRRISHELHPAALQRLGLVLATRSFCKDFGTAHKITIEFDEKGVPALLPDDISVCLYRIIQESLNNVVKHSNASSARVEIIADTEELRLVVSDEGNGFDPLEAVTNSSLGLISMRERVRLVGGKLSIRSQMGKGTRIMASIPLDLLPATAPNLTH